MNASDIRWAKDWRLRARITNINMARRGAAKFPNGMSSMLTEDLDREEKLIRAEIEKRRSAALQAI